MPLAAPADISGSCLLIALQGRANAEPRPHAMKMARAKAAPLQAFGRSTTRRVFNQIAPRGLKQILDWEKALAESSNSTL